METRTCYRCRIDKPLAAFTQRVDDRHFNMCRACVSEILTSRTGAKQRLRHTDTERTCYLCRRILPREAFTQRSNGTYFSACRDCNRHVFATRRRARLAASEGTYSRAEWEALVAQYDRCPSCLRHWDDIPKRRGSDTVITVDHIVPISRGGANTIDNLQPLCYSCNSKKGAR